MTKTHNTYEASSFLESGEIPSITSGLSRKGGLNEYQALPADALRFRDKPEP